MNTSACMGDGAVDFPMKILGDKDVDRLVPMKDAVKLIEAGFRAQSEGHLVAPPRHWVEFVHGSLGFTIGGYDVDGGSVGLRVYSVFEGETKSDTQATLVFDARTGGLEGALVGNRLGIVRTGAIGELHPRGFKSVGASVTPTGSDEVKPPINELLPDRTFERPTADGRVRGLG